MSKEQPESFMERRQAAEREPQATSPNDKGASFLERHETHVHEHRHETHIHHHHYGAPQKSGKEQFLEDLGRDIAKGIEETLKIH